MSENSYSFMHLQIKYTDIFENGKFPLAEYKLLVIQYCNTATLLMLKMEPEKRLKKVMIINQQK